MQTDTRRVRAHKSSNKSYNTKIITCEFLNAVHAALANAKGCMAPATFEFKFEEMSLVPPPYVGGRTSLIQLW